MSDEYVPTTPMELAELMVGIREAKLEESDGTWLLNEGLFLASKLVFLALRRKPLTLEMMPSSWNEEMEIDALRAYTALRVQKMFTKEEAMKLTNVSMMHRRL